MWYVIVDNNSGRFLTVTADYDGCYELGLNDNFTTNFTTNIALFEASEIDHVLDDIVNKVAPVIRFKNTVFTLMFDRTKCDLEATSLLSFSQRV